MPNYITALNQLLIAETAKHPGAVLYGENIDTGSCICGMTRGVKAPPGGRLINVGNCEATHCGAGMGVMLNGGRAVLFAKQLDFMLLGMDHFVNTFGLIRTHRSVSELGSFTIVAIVCDQGFQGPQSSFNALGDLCSAARVPGYTLTNAQDAALVLKTQLGKPGFRFICLSQRMFGTELIAPQLVWSAEDLSSLQYSEGEDVTIACFNFSLPQGLELQKKCAAKGLSASVFSVNHVLPADWSRLLADYRRTGRLVVLDDSKSQNLPAYRLLHEAAQLKPEGRRVVLAREDELDFGVSADELKIDYEAVVAGLLERQPA